MTSLLLYALFPRIKRKKLTSFTIILQGLSEVQDAERNKLLSDTEGTSDKYARTICSWWVIQLKKEISATIGETIYTDTITQSYQITLNGLKAVKYIKGTSKFQRIPKRVMWDMLATKVIDRDYLRNRRTYLLNALQSDYRSLEYLKKYLDNSTVALDTLNSCIRFSMSNFLKYSFTFSIAILKASFHFFSI